jgi:aryl-alcohol dehydrogenase-like predicted oxidoreductase
MAEEGLHARAARWPGCSRGAGTSCRSGHQAEDRLEENVAAADVRLTDEVAALQEASRRRRRGRALPVPAMKSVYV